MCFGNDYSKRHGHVLHVFVYLVLTIGYGSCNGIIQMTSATNAQSDIYYERYSVKEGHSYKITCDAARIYESIATAPNLVWKRHFPDDLSFEVHTCQENTNLVLPYMVGCPRKGVSILEIANVTKSDNGTKWLCVGPGFQPNTTVVLEAKRMAVVDGPHEITFLPHNGTVYERPEGSQLNITCTAVCFSKCSFTWTKQSGYNRPVLSFDNLSRSDSGNYTCTAKNGNIFFLSERHVEIIVTYGPSQVQIVPDLEVFEEVERTQLDLTCMAECQPPCNFTWVSTVSNEVVSSTPMLRMSHLQRSSAGQYHCIARNKISTVVSKHVDILVKYGPGEIQLTPPLALFDQHEGTQVHVTCASKCNPNCSYTWTNLLTGSKTFSEALTFDSLNRSDSGVYICTAGNGIWDATKTVQINVSYGPYQVDLTPDRPKHVLPLGDDLYITCFADCSPYCTYSWVKQGQPHKHSMSDNQVLHVSRLKRSDAGIYICKASNRGITDFRTVDLRVKYYPDAPRHLKFVNFVNGSCIFCWDSIEIQDNELVIDVQIGDKNESKTSYRVEKTHVFEIHSGQHCVLVAANIGPGIYTAIMLVQNEYGQATSNPCSFEITAKSQTEPSDTSNGRTWAIVGFVATGCTTVIIITVIVILALKKKCRKGLGYQMEEMLIIEENRTDGDALPAPQDPVIDLSDNDNISPPPRPQRQIPYPANRTGSPQQPFAVLSNRHCFASDATQRTRRPLPPEPPTLLSNTAPWHTTRVPSLSQSQLLDIARQQAPWISNSTRPLTRQPYGLDVEVGRHARPLPFPVENAGACGPSVPPRPRASLIVRSAQLSHQRPHMSFRVDPSRIQVQTTDVEGETQQKEIACDNLYYGRIDDFLDMHSVNNSKENVYAEMKTPPLSIQKTNIYHPYINIIFRQWVETLNKMRRKSWHFENKAAFSFSNQRRRHTIDGCG